MRSGYVDSAPLVPFIRRAIVERAQSASSGTHAGGLALLARDVAERFGTRWQSEQRALLRMLAGGWSLSPRAADRWAIALGLHPLIVWGEDAMRPVVARRSEPLEVRREARRAYDQERRAALRAVV